MKDRHSVDEGAPPAAPRDALLARMESLLRDGDSEAVALLEVQEATLQETLGERFEAFRDLVQRFEFDQAQKLMAKGT